MRERIENLTRAVRIAAGGQGKGKMLSVFVEGRRLRGATGEPVAVPVRPLGGRPIWLRPGTTDLSNAVAYLSLGLYLPPPEIRAERLTAICELGTNMGAALTALATRYDGARLLGVEPDTANAAVARLNLRPVADRARVLEAAVWDEPGVVRIERDTGRGEHGFAVQPLAPGEDAEGTLPALTIDQIFEELSPGGTIDYVHVSLEGTEERVFAAGGDWVERVRSLRVEAHPYLDYPAARCIEQLRALGFRAWADPELPDKWVYAVRDGLAASRSQTDS